MLKKADAFDHFRQRTRRRFLAILGLSVPLAAGAGFALAHWSMGSPRKRLPDPVDARVVERLEWAHRLANGPDGALLAASTTFLMVLDRCGGDVALWRGFARLVRMAEADGQERRALAARLLVSAEAQELPVELRGCEARLRELVK